MFFFDDDVLGLLFFEDGLGGEVDRFKGGGVLVLGFEFGVRGILGFEIKGDLNVDLFVGGLIIWGGGFEFLLEGVGFVFCLVFEGFFFVVLFVVGFELCFDLDDVVGLFCCLDFGRIVEVNGWGVLFCIVFVFFVLGVVGFVRGWLGLRGIGNFFLFFGCWDRLEFGIV